jgi:hypothetical protein
MQDMRVTVTRIGACMPYKMFVQSLRGNFFDFLKDFMQEGMITCEQQTKLNGTAAWGY